MHSTYFFSLKKSTYDCEQYLERLKASLSYWNLSVTCLLALSDLKTKQKNISVSKDEDTSR
jgi:hypothetical protein